MRTVLILSVVLLAATACTSKFDAAEPLDPTTTTTNATEPARPPPPVIVAEMGFDTDGVDCSGWVVTGGKAYTTEAITASGLKSCRVCMQTGTSVVVERAVPVEHVATYTLVAHVRNESTRAHAVLSFTDDAGTADFGTFREALANGNDFKRITVTGKPAERPTKARIVFSAEKAGGFSCIDFDDVELAYQPDR